MRMCTRVSVKELKINQDLLSPNSIILLESAAVLNLSGTDGVLEIYSHSPMKNFTIFQSGEFSQKCEKIFLFLLFSE